MKTSWCADPFTLKIIIKHLLSETDSLSGLNKTYSTPQLKHEMETGSHVGKYFYSSLCKKLKHLNPILQIKGDTYRYVLPFEEIEHSKLYEEEYYILTSVQDTMAILEGVSKMYPVQNFFLVSILQEKKS